MADTIDVDIWADIVCPWCAIGGTQLLQAVADLRGEVDVTVRFMPFELNPDIGAEGEEQIALLAKAYEKSPAEVLAMRRDVEVAGAAAGFAMSYQGEGVEPVLMVWNTHAAHKLLRWALATGSPAAQVRLAQALFAAHFQLRRNLSDRAVLLDIAAAEGFDREAAADALADEALSTAIRLEERRALDNGISSVPTAVVAGKYILQGAAPPEKFRQALVQIAQMEAAA